MSENANAELGEGEGEGREQGGRDGGIVRSEHDHLAPWRSGDCTRALPSRLEHEKLTEDPNNNPARCIESCKNEGFQFAAVQGTACRCEYEKPWFLFLSFTLCLSLSLTLTLIMYAFVLVLRCGNIRPLAEDFVPDGCYQPCPEGTLELCGGGGQRSHEWNVFSTKGKNSS